MNLPQPLVSVIILNYNGKKVIRPCLESLINQTYKNLETIVVDNASADGSVEIIKKDFPSVRLIINEANLGFGAGNNIGIGAAAGEFLLVLNNDARLESDCVEELVRSINKDQKYGACAAKILLEYEKGLLDVAGIAICSDGISIGRGRLEPHDRFNTEEEVFFASGCASLYRRKMLDDIRLSDEIYDEDFFAYADDTDLGWRAQLAGWKCIYNPKAIVYHLHSASTSNYSSLKAFLVERNRIWVAVKNFTLTMLLSGLFYTFRRYYFQTYGVLKGKGASGKFAKEAKKTELLKILINANICAVKGLPAMLGKRRQIFKKKRIGDKEIQELFKRFGLSAKEIALKE